MSLDAFFPRNPADLIRMLEASVGFRADLGTGYVSSDQNLCEISLYWLIDTDPYHCLLYKRLLYNTIWWYSPLYTATNTGFDAMNSDDRAIQED